MTFNLRQDRIDFLSMSFWYYVPDNNHGFNQHNWRGHANVRRWFRARQDAGGVDPSEQDSLGQPVDSDSNEDEDYIEILGDDA